MRTLCRRKTEAKIPLIAGLVIIQQTQALPVRSFQLRASSLCYGANLLPGHFVYCRHSCPFGQKKVSLLKHLILSKSHFTSYPSHTYSFPSHPFFPFPLTFLLLSYLQNDAPAKAGFQHVRYMMLRRRSVRALRSPRRSFPLRSDSPGRERTENWELKQLALIIWFEWLSLGTSHPEPFQTKAVVSIHFFPFLLYYLLIFTLTFYTDCNYLHLINILINEYSVNFNP